MESSEPGDWPPVPCREEELSEAGPTEYGEVYGREGRLPGKALSLSCLLEMEVFKAARLPRGLEKHQHSTGLHWTP